MAIQNSAVQCTVVRFSAVNHALMGNATLYWRGINYTVQCSAVYCTALIQFNEIQCSAGNFRVLQRTVQCSTVKCALLYFNSTFQFSAAYFIYKYSAMQ